jgi:hypothetical protein
LTAIAQLSINDPVDRLDFNANTHFNANTPHLASGDAAAELLVAPAATDVLDPLGAAPLLGSGGGSGGGGGGGGGGWRSKNGDVNEDGDSEGALLLTGASDDIVGEITMTRSNSQYARSRKNSSVSERRFSSSEQDPPPAPPLPPRTPWPSSHGGDDDSDDNGDRGDIGGGGDGDGASSLKVISSDITFASSSPSTPPSSSFDSVFPEHGTGMASPPSSSSSLPSSSSSSSSSSSAAAAAASPAPVVSSPPLWSDGAAEARVAELTEQSLLSTDSSSTVPAPLLPWPSAAVAAPPIARLDAIWEERALAGR